MRLAYLVLFLVSAALAQTPTPAPCWTPQLSDQMGSGGGWLMFGIGILSTLIVGGLVYFLCTLRWTPRVAPDENAHGQMKLPLYTGTYSYYPVLSVYS
jgi:hypothetical protein